MKRKFELSTNMVMVIEIIIFVIVAMWARQMLEALLAPMGLQPVILLMIRILFVFLIMALALVVDRAIFSLLRKAGIVRESPPRRK